NYGVMSAKNGAINTMILLSALSYILYKRANKVITARWARTGDLVIGTVFCGGLANVIAVSVYGFYLPANVRVGLSLPQALSTLTLNMALFWLLLVGVFWLSQRGLRQAEATEWAWAGRARSCEGPLSPAMTKPGLLGDG